MKGVPWFRISTANKEPSQLTEMWVAGLGRGTVRIREQLSLSAIRCERSTGRESLVKGRKGKFGIITLQLGGRGSREYQAMLTGGGYQLAVVGDGLRGGEQFQLAKVVEGQVLEGEGIAGK